MFNNFYEKTKNFIKETYKSIIFFILLYIVLMYPVNYYIVTGGGTMSVSDKIKIEDGYKSKGSFNLSYVSEIKGTVATYLLSYIVPSWDLLKVSDYTYNDKEDAKDVYLRSVIDLENANSFAIKNAYSEANKTYTVKDSSVYVYYIDPKNKNDFKVGDKVLKIEGNTVNSIENYKDVISTHDSGDTVKVLLERNSKEKEISVKLYKKNGGVLSGVFLNQVNTYKTYPKIKFKFSKTESGPSGGLIETLEIYNKLTKYDLTKGRKIAGTGEIDEDGNIVSIGGVKYKLAGAVKDKADIFIVPEKNYKTCLREKKKNNYKIKIISVSTFKEAIYKLNR